MSWEFFIGRSSDMAMLHRITDATGKRLDPVFNQKGSFSATIPIDSPGALVVDKWKHCLIVQKPDGTIAWSGPVTTVVDSAEAGTTTLTAAGWQTELDYRWIRNITELQDAVAYTIPSPTYPNPSFDTNTTGWTAGTSTITRDTATTNSAPASGRWDNTGASDTLGVGDTLSTTLTGKFFAGTAYYFQFYLRANATSTGDFKCQFGNITGGDYVELTFAATTSFAVKNWTWIPKKDYDAADMKFTAVLGGKYYWIDTFTIQDSLHDNAPAFPNASFGTNTTGWTATTSTITRDTTVMDSGTASGRWDNTGASDNLGASDVLETTSFSGTFYKGVTYTVTIRLKSSATSGTTFPILMSFGYPGDKVSSWIKFESTKFTSYSISWTPSLTLTTGVTFGMLVSVTSPFFYLNIDSCKVERTGGRSVFTDTDDGKIAEALVRLANRQTDSSETTRATHLTPVAVSTTKRTRTYQIGQNIGAAIRELSEIENGFDIEIDYTTRNITFASNTSYTDRTTISYGYRAFPNNLDDVIVNDDGTSKANSINVQGAYIIGNADDPTDIADVGIILEDWLSASDIQNEQIVGAYANEEIVFRKDGLVTISAKPTLGAFMPFIDYDLGDKVYITATRGRLQLDRQAVRVFSCSITWNNQNEPVLDELGLTP